MSTPLLEHSSRTPEADLSADEAQYVHGHPLAHLAVGLSLWVAMLAAMASLHGVVEGYGWLLTICFPLLLLHGVAGILRGTRWPRWLAPAGALVVAGSSVLLHPALGDPTLGATRGERLVQVVNDAGLELATQVPAVAYTLALDFMFLALALALGVLIETLVTVRKLASLVVLPLALAPVIASLFKQSGAGTGYLVLLLFALITYFVFLPYTAARRGAAAVLPRPRQLRFAAILAALAALTLMVSSAWMPGFRQGMFPEGSRISGDLFASNIDPLLNLGRDLRTNSSSLAVGYFTTADSAPYLRTHVIEDLDTSRWEPTQGVATRPLDGSAVFRDQLMSFGGKQAVTELQWQRAPRSLRLPLPSHSYFIQGVGGHWQWEPATAIATFDRQSREATNNVTVSHSVPKINAEMARNFAFFDSAEQAWPDDSLLALPQDPEGTREQLLRQTLDEAFETLDRPQASDFDAAVAIQNFLRSSRFQYSEQTPLREGYDGANMDVIEAFLEYRQGYCVHFASTMAVLARTAGIPSRIVIGYAPGQPTGETMTVAQLEAQTPGSLQLPPQTEMRGYQVTGQQAHAWPEVYLEGLGWTPFEPTPGRGQPPEYAPAPEISAAPDPTLNDSRPLDATDAPESAAASPEAEAQGSNDPHRAEDSVFWPLAGWVLGPLLLLGLLCAPALRGRQRQRHLQQLRQAGGGAAASLWHELRANAANYGQPVRAAETVAEYCQRLASYYPAARQPLAKIATAIQDSFYAERHPQAGQVQDLEAALDAVAQTMARQTRMTLRLRAFFFPVSVRARRAARERVPAT